MQILQSKIIIPAKFVFQVSHIVINALILLHVFYVQIIYFCQFQVIIVLQIALPVTFSFLFLLAKKFKFINKNNY